MGEDELKETRYVFSRLAHCQCSTYNCLHRSEIRDKFLAIVRRVREYESTGETGDDCYCNGGYTILLREFLLHIRERSARYQ